VDDRCNLGDFNLCQESLDGSESAIAFLQRQFGPKSRSYLIGAGACPAEAAEIIDSLWADLLAPVNDRPPRLRRYDGSCALQTWLNTVALNRLLTRKRTEQRWKRIISPNPGPLEGDDFATSERSAAALAEPEDAGFGEAPLVEIMRTAVETAFLSCDPEDFVLLQLKHCDGLRGAELGKMFGCDESVISRRLDRAQERIASMTLWKIRQTDPWLELKWSDFLELCRSATPACFGLD
jgi:RNA polymerase sigma factor (sigma-70 family)